MTTKLEQKGRKGDKLIAHLTPGEIVIPRALAEDDDFRAVIAHFMRENGAVPEQFIVGSGKNKTNPETGYMEFGWNPIKDVKKAIKKVGKELSRTYKSVSKEISRAVTPKIPKPPPLPPPAATPTQLRADVLQRQEDRRKLRRRAAGRRGTILAGGLGGGTTLLGGKI